MPTITFKYPTNKRRKSPQIRDLYEGKAHIAVIPEKFSDRIVYKAVLVFNPPYEGTL